MKHALQAIGDHLLLRMLSPPQPGIIGKSAHIHAEITIRKSQ